MDGNTAIAQLSTLSGLHAGAQIVLQTGCYIIGRSAQCDIIFVDNSVAERHFQLQVSHEGTWIKALDRTVDMDGLEIKESKRCSKKNQVIRIGEIQCCISSLVEAPTSNDETQYAKNEYAKPCTTSKKRSRNSVVYKYLYEVSCVKKLKYILVGVLLLFAELFTFSNANTVSLAKSEFNAADQLAIAIRARELTNVEVSLREENTINIRGYVDTVTQRRALDALLKEAKIPTKVRVWTTSEMLRSANLVLKALGLHKLIAMPAAPGELLITGFVAKQEQWLVARELLLQDIPGINHIDDHGITTLSSSIENLTRLLHDYDLEEKVQLNIDDEQLSVTGALSPSEMQSWHNTMKIYKSQFPNGASLNIAVQDTSQLINLNIQSVSMGDTLFLVASDGKKYMEGAHLGDDFFIRKIEADQILLTRNDREYLYSIGDKNGTDKFYRHRESTNK